MHDNLAQVEDVATEITLVRACADVCKVAYLLRAKGNEIEVPALEKYDKLLQSSLERLLGGPIGGPAVMQASLGVKEGGLGFRRAQDLALPAFISSRLEARWLIGKLIQNEAFSKLPVCGMITSYDDCTNEAINRFEQSLPEGARLKMQSVIDDFRTTAIEDRRSHAPRLSALAGDGLVVPAGAEDNEAEGECNLQSKLCSIADEYRADYLDSLLHVAGDWNGKRRLRELRDSTTSHTWLWSLNPCHGPIVPPTHFLTAVRLRLGAPSIESMMVCPRCGREDLDRPCAHALCCSIPEATRGHNKVRDVVLQLAHLADPSASSEPLNLIPSAPMLRPADVLTSAAFPGCLAALDIGVSSPDSSGAGDDCCESMRARKCNDYADYLLELQDNGVRYQPLTFSAYGRMHLETESVLLSLSLRAARRRGLRDHRPILKRACSAIGVQIWKRAASMVLACLPSLEIEEERLLFGCEAS